MTPECYQAHAIIKALAVGLLILPCLLIFPLISAAVVVLAVLVYFKEIQKAEKHMESRREEIETELLRFVSTVEQELASRRDVLSILGGLISVIRGDNGKMYFQMLSHDFKQMELRKLKAKAQKIPGKIRVFSIIMLMCFLATYLIVIAYQIIQSIGVMF